MYKNATIDVVHQPSARSDAAYANVDELFSIIEIAGGSCDELHFCRAQ
jgi:hypothetical protein